MSIPATFDLTDFFFDSETLTFDLETLPVPEAYLPELRKRLQNPAVTDADLLMYILEASRDVSPAHYSPSDFDAQILDTACQLLAVDNKFPEIQSISSQGVSTSFSANDPERYRRRIAGRRAAAWM